MKILLLTTFILLFMAHFNKSHSTVNKAEILESKGYHIINPPSNIIFWDQIENQKWLALYAELDTKIELLIPNMKTNPESFKAFKGMVDTFVRSPSFDTFPQSSIIKKETVTDCHLQHGDILRILGSSRDDDTMIVVEAHQYKYHALNYDCEETDIFVLPKAAIGKPSEMDVDVPDVGQIVYYNKDSQWVNILDSWTDRIEWINTVRKYFDIQPTQQDICHIKYGKPVKVLDYFDNESLAFVESQSTKLGTACGKRDQFYLSTTTVGKLIPYF